MLLQVGSDWVDNWRWLSMVDKLFLLLLFVFGLYTLYRVSVIVIRSRSLRTARDERHRSVSLGNLKRRAASLDRATTAMFYLFGLVFFLQLPFAFNTLGDGPRPLGGLIMENLNYQFRFGAFVFFVFLVLHLVQWFGASRIDRAERI